MANKKRNVLSHPVVNAELSKLRQSSTSPKEFREVGDFCLHEIVIQLAANT